MQCTSFIQVYHHSTDLNVGSSGFSWHLSNSKTNYREKNGYDISVPPYSMEQDSSYDKEMLRQIIQEHDTTFRHQVQELHRLYKKQRELMEETSIRKVFSQRLLSQTSGSIHSLPHARSNISQAISHATSWLLGDHSQSILSQLTPENIQQPPEFIPSNYLEEHLILHAAPFIRKNSFNEVNYPSSRSNGNENRIFGLELPANIRNQFTETNLSEETKLTCTAPEKDPNIPPVTDSEMISVKTRDLSSINLNNWKRHCFIDLNEPSQTDSLPSSSKCPMETYTCLIDIVNNESVVLKDSRLFRCDGKSDSRNSPVAINLNSLPDDYYPDTEINFATEDYPFVNSNLVKTETDIDLNTDVVTNEPSLPLSNSTVQMKSGGDRDIEGPLSPENEECSPPRGKSEENIQLEISSLLSEQESVESYMEIDTMAARTLVLISSCGAHDFLSWFADIVSAIGDDLENKTTNGAYNDQVEVLSVSDLEAVAFDFSCVVKKEKETGNSFVGSQKGDARGTRRHKDSRTKVMPSQSKNAQEIEGFIETGLSRRRMVKKACDKPRKCSNVSSGRVKKPMSSILKQPAMRIKHEVFWSWGKIKKREGGVRRKAGKFLVPN